MKSKKITIQKDTSKNILTSYLASGGMKQEILKPYTHSTR